MGEPWSNMKRRGMLINAALVLVAFGLLGFTVWLNRDKIAEVFNKPVDFRYFGVGFAIYMVALMLTFFRWYTLVRALDLPFSYRDAIRLGFIGNVFNLVIPGAVGGDVIKGAFLCREQSRKASAVASMIIDRILGLSGLFLLAGIAGLFAWGSADAKVKTLVGLVWLALFGGFTFLGILFTPSLYPILTRLSAGREKLGRIFHELESMAMSYRSRIGVVIAGLLLSSFIHSMFVLAFYTLSLALFDKVPTLAEHYLMVPLALFTTAVPIPFGALGLSEAVSQGLFNMVQYQKGAVAMMAFRVLMYAGGLVSVCVYLANMSQVRSLKSDAAHLAEDIADGTAL